MNILRIYTNTILDSLHVLNTKLFLTVELPPNPSLKLIPALGELKKILESNKFEQDLA